MVQAAYIDSIHVATLNLKLCGLASSVGTSHIPVRFRNLGNELKFSVQCRCVLEGAEIANSLMGRCKIECS